jgi:L-ascorbate metabolism protein UlaG (beta-lactamase superfamily)
MVVCTLLIGKFSVAGEPGAQDVTIQLIRNATVRVSYGNATFLVDPMLAETGAYPGFDNTYRSELRNPLVPLPMPAKEVVQGIDAVIVTHTHLDHWDDAAQQAIPKEVPLIVQDSKDAALIRSQGFKNVHILQDKMVVEGVTLERTECQHGSEAMFADKTVGPLLGSVMGIVFKKVGMKTVYIAADTVWFPGVEQAIEKNAPDVIVLNTGGAALTHEQFRDNPYIIMGKEDTLRAYRLAPKAAIVSVHMDAINHMTVDRKDLSEYTYRQGIRDRVLIPFDGETLHFSKDTGKLGGS